MDSARRVRRFRSNPIEVVIFSVISIILVNSIYHLFYDHPGFTPATLTSLNSDPKSEGRHLASTVQPLQSVEIPCVETSNQETSANRLRVKGSLCGIDSVRTPSSLVKTSIVNMENKFIATVFADVEAGQYSTDYIPLTVGENHIHFEFSYRGGKTVSQELLVVRN